jgi:predicted Zn-dependent protease
MAIGRIAAMMLALVVCAWFALGIRQAHNTAKVNPVVSKNESLTRAQAAAADRTLSAAGTLNPDAEVDLLRGRIALLASERARAAGIFAALARREPMNVQAWVYLAQATDNARLRGEAIRMIARLFRTPKR